MQSTLSWLPRISHAFVLLAALLPFFLLPGCDAPDSDDLDDEDVFVPRVAALVGNIAVGMPASQSSDYAFGYAARAVDGNTDGNWIHDSVTATGFDAQAWWQVDLLARREIGDVVVWNRTDCCGERLSDFRLRVSDDGTTWQDYPHPGTADPETTFTVDRSARYVRVQLDGQNYLSLAEVQVFAPNLAEGRVATQSSTGFASPPSLAVDGDIEGDWTQGSVTHTNSEPGAWWQVDLGSDYAIDRIVLYNRTDCCSERLTNFVVEVSQNGSDYFPVAIHAGEAGRVTAFAGTGTARYVRVRLNGTGYLSLAEVQVFGAPNLAFGRGQWTSQSSYYANPLEPYPYKAVDGHRNGNFLSSSVTHTDNDDQAWWHLDLGSSQSVGTVVLYNRTDCCSDRLSDFDLLLSEDGVSWDAFHYLGAAPDRVDFDVDTQARYIAVQLQGTNYLSLAEVEVFAQ